MVLKLLAQFDHILISLIILILLSQQCPDIHKPPNMIIARPHSLHYRRLNIFLHPTQSEIYFGQESTKLEFQFCYKQGLF